MSVIRRKGELRDGSRIEDGQVSSPYDLPYGHPLRRDENEDMDALREQLRGAVEASETLRLALDVLTDPERPDRAARNEAVRIIETHSDAGGQ